MFFQNMSSEILIFSSPIGYPYRINEWDFRRQLQSSWQKTVGQGHFFDTLNFNSWIKPYIKSFFSFNCTIFIKVYSGKGENIKLMESIRMLAEKGGKKILYSCSFYNLFIMLPSKSSCVRQCWECLVFYIFYI